MAGLRIQQAANPATQFKPHPVVIAPDGAVLHGRPDASRLIGFQYGEVQTVVVWAKDAIEEPTKAVGLVPVFAPLTGGGVPFHAGRAVVEAEGWTL